MVIRVSLLIKKVLRDGDAHPRDGAPDESLGAPLYAAPPHRAVALDEGRGDFEAPFVSQRVAPDTPSGEAPPAATPAPASEFFPQFGDAPEENEGAHLAGDVSEGGAAPMELVEGSDADGPSAEPREEQGQPTPTPAHVLRYEDLKPEREFFAEGFGPDGAQALKPPVGEAPISDRIMMQKLFQSGKSTLTVKAACDLKFKVPDAVAKTPKKACPQASVIRLFQTFAGAFPRLAVYDHEARELRLRNLRGSASGPPTPKRGPISSPGRKRELWGLAGAARGHSRARAGCTGAAPPPRCCPCCGFGAEASGGLQR